MTFSRSEMILIHLGAVGLFSPKTLATRHNIAQHRGANGARRRETQREREKERLEDWQKKRPQQFLVGLLPYRTSVKLYHRSFSYVRQPAVRESIRFIDSLFQYSNVMQIKLRMQY